MTKNSATALFDNLIPAKAFLECLKGQFKMRTFYFWCSKGMPCKKIRSKLYAVVPDAFEWLERTSQEHGNS